MRSLGIATSLCLAVFLFGCGGSSQLKLGKVYGRVTLDGQPLTKAVIQFIPVESPGQTSMGVTNDRGEYLLSYTYDKQGALLGEHRVVIQSAGSSDESRKDPLLSPSYNSETKLHAHVKKGSNHIEFDLNSQGKVTE